MKRCLVIFSSNALASMVAKGNLSYLRHYEAYFERVYVIYFTGSYPKIIRMGRTILISLGQSERFLRDIFLSPWRCWHMFRRLKPDVVLTADIVFSFWSMRFIGWRQSYFLMPVCLVNEVMATKEPYFFRRKWLDRLTVGLSVRYAPKILLNRDYPALNAFFEANPTAQDKIHYVSRLVEELPPTSFLEALAQATSHEQRPPHSRLRLLHVGRLSKDKYIDDLLDLMVLLREANIDADLDLVGPGTPQECAAIQQRLDAEQLDGVHLPGPAYGVALVDYLSRAEIIVSPKMGTALREAGLCGACVVCYRDAFTEATLTHKVDAYLTTENNARGLLEGIQYLLQHPDMRKRLRQQIKKTFQPWNPDNCHAILEEAFG